MSVRLEPLFLKHESTKEIPRKRGMMGIRLFVLSFTMSVFILVCGPGAVEASPTSVVLSGRDLTVNVGGAPVAVAVSPNGTYSYVADSGSDSITVISTKEHAVSATLRIGVSPTGLAVSPNGRYLCVTGDLGSGILHGRSLYVINTSTNAVKSEVDVGGDSNGVAVSSDGRFAYVTTDDPMGITVVRTSDDRVAGHLSTQSVPYEVALNPDGRTLYADSEYGGDNPLYIVDVTRMKIVKTLFEKGASPFDLIVDQRNSAIYESFNGGAAINNLAVQVLSMQSDRKTATINFDKGARGLIVSPDGKTVYACNADGTGISVINTATNTVSSELFLKVVPGVAPWALGISPDGKYLYVTNFSYLNNSFGTLTIIPL